MTAEQLRRVRAMADVSNYFWGAFTANEEYDAAALAAVLARLEACEEALAEARAANVVLAHDESRTWRRQYAEVVERIDAALAVRP